MSEITEEEFQVVVSLGKAWDAFQELDRPLRPNSADDDLADFRKAIHDAQRIVMSFPTQRLFLAECKEGDENAVTKP